MPTQIGSATSNIDLLQKLVTWLVTRGWTNNMSQADGSGWRSHLSKGGLYVHLRASVLNDATWHDNVANSGNTNYALHLYLGTGFSGGNAFMDQAGGPVQNGTAYSLGVCVVTGSGAIASYQFLDDGSDNITIWIERTAGIWRNLGWGNLSKIGSWTGGAYFFGSSAGYYGSTSYDTGTYQAKTPARCEVASVAFLRADVDAFTGKWLGIGSTTNPILGYTGKRGASNVEGTGNEAPTDVPYLNQYALNKLHNTQAARAITVPITLFGARDGGGYSALGEIPSLRVCGASEVGGASLGTDVPIESATWRVFPGCASRVTA